MSTGTWKIRSAGNLIRIEQRQARPESCGSVTRPAQHRASLEGSREGEGFVSVLSQGKGRCVEGKKHLGKRMSVMHLLSEHSLSLCWSSGPG